MNFVFEDDFDFKKELQKNVESSSSMCLITGNPIIDECKLKCNHSYNYDSLFKEVYNQKINPKFKNDIHLKDNEIKCPYCRKTQQGLLPERNKIFRVTTINKDYEIDPNIVPTVDCLQNFKNGKCALPSCNKKQVTFLKRLNENVCCFHIKIPKTQLLRHIKLHNYLLKYPETTMEDIPYTLWEEIKKEEMDTKLKLKAEAKQAKDEAKAQAKQAKDEAKAQAKQAKDEAKAQAKQAKDEAKAQAKQAKDEAKAQAKQAKSNHSIVK